MPDGHEAHTEEKTEGSSKVGDEGIESVDVRFLRHIHRGIAWPEGKYEVLTLEWKTLWFSMELELVENARPLAIGYSDNSFVIIPSQIPIESIIIPEAFSLGRIFKGCFFFCRGDVVWEFSYPSYLFSENKANKNQCQPYKRLTGPILPISFWCNGETDTAM